MPGSRTARKQKFITSRSGIFQVANLMPGQYEITFGKKPYDSMSVTIPEDAEGLYRLSQLIVKKRLKPLDLVEARSDLNKTLKRKQVQQIKPMNKIGKNYLPYKKMFINI